MVRFEKEWSCECVPSRTSGGQFYMMLSCCRQRATSAFMITFKTGFKATFKNCMTPTKELLWWLWQNSTRSAFTKKVPQRRLNQWFIVLGALRQGLGRTKGTKTVHEIGEVDYIDKRGWMPPWHCIVFGRIRKTPENEADNEVGRSACGKVRQNLTMFVI